MNNKKNLISKEDTIFIAGHKGMVGKSIENELRSKGYTRIITISKKELDLSIFSEVENFFKKHKPNIVILAAAKVGGIAANNKYPTEFLLDNLKIQNNVIESAWKNNTRRLLFLGSSCIYPKFAVQPINEEQLLSNSLESTNKSYAIAKICGLQLCSSLRKQYKFDAISLMPTNLYGQGDNYHSENSHVLPALIRRFHEAKENGLSEVCIWGTGNPRRELLHTDDLANALLFLLKLENPPHWVNIGTGKDHTILEIANLIKEIIGFRGKITHDLSKPDGMTVKRLDVGLMDSLGWKSSTELTTGIKETYEDFLLNLKVGTARL